MRCNRLILLLAILLVFALGGPDAVEAQKVRARPSVAKTVKGQRAKAKKAGATRTTRPGLVKGFKGLFKRKQSKKSGQPDSAALKSSTSRDARKASTSVSGAQKAEAPAANGKKANAKPAAGAGAKAKAAKGAKEARAGKSKEQSGGKDKAAKSILPERKTPIHEKLKDPNAFGEKDKIENTVPVERWKGADKALTQLQEPGNWFFSGDSGRLMAARLINRESRNDGDFHNAYGQQSFRNFAKADSILNAIPKGQFASKLDVALLAKVNKTAFAEGGDGAVVTAGKSLRTLFSPKTKIAQGEVRSYQNMFFARKGLSKVEAANVKEHGAKFIKLPFTRMGFIIYAKPSTVRPGLDKLIASTKAKMKDPKADPVETASHFVQKFIALHPFADGNGRTARLVMDRMLAEHGLLPPILKNTGNDIGLTKAEFSKQVLQGIARTGKFLNIRPHDGAGELSVGAGSLRGAAAYVERSMKEYGHTIAGIGSQKLAKREGLSFGLGKDGFVYDLAGRPYMADKRGDLRPMSQMTMYILMRRISQRKNAPDILQQITNPTRIAFDKLLKAGSAGKGPKVHSDASAIKADGSLSVNVGGVNKEMFISLLNPTNVSAKNLFAPDKGASPLTMIMSRYQQADLELWHVGQSFKGKGDKASIAKIEKHRDVLFSRARAELHKRIKKGSKDDDNPLGAKHEYERLQYQHSPLRYADRKSFVKKHGDSDATIFRGENFAKWSGVHIDSVPFRPGLKATSAMYAKKQGALKLFDLLRTVQVDTVGTGVQSYTTDLALLARKGGFADKTTRTQVDLSAMSKIARGLVGVRVKEGESIEITPKTTLLSAIFTRRNVTRKGHISLGETDAKRLKEYIEQAAPSEKVAALSERVAKAQKKAGKKGLWSGLTGWIGGPKRVQIKADDLLSQSELGSLHRLIGDNRNLVTVRRDGDKLAVTAHRRANVFKVQKKHMLPGTDSLAGRFMSEQEVHVMATVLPHRIIGTVTQKQLSTELGVKAAKPAMTVEKLGPQPQTQASPTLAAAQ